MAGVSSGESRLKVAFGIAAGLGTELFRKCPGSPKGQNLPMGRGISYPAIDGQFGGICGDAPFFRRSDDSRTTVLPLILAFPKGDFSGCAPRPTK